MNHLSSILVIAPHPDDEALGCGGLLAKIKLQRNQTKTYVLYLSSGESKWEIREDEARRSNAILNVDGQFFLRFQKSEFSLDLANLEKILNVFMSVRPDVVLTPHENDGDAEHNAAYQQIKQCVWRYNESLEKNQKRISMLASYEIHKPIQHPTFLEDISSTIDTKRKSLNEFSSQLTHTHINEAIIGLNRYRGQLHSGFDYAEAYEVKFMDSVFSETE
jgi:LmbE family N-acetylglucosaminyl deacetylase